MTIKPVITPIELTDEKAVLSFLQRNMGVRFDSGHSSETYLTWLSRASSVAGIGWLALGWKLVEQGEIRGVHLVTPFRSLNADGQPFHDLVSHNFFVEEGYRGMPSLALFQRLLALRSQYRLKATTANALSSGLWKSFRATPVKTSDSEVFQTRLSAHLLAEAIARAFPRSVSLLRRLIPAQGLLGARVDGVVAALDCVEKLSTDELLAHAVELAKMTAHPGLDINEAMLRWILADPLVPRRLVPVRVGQKRSVIGLAAMSRGRWAQIGCISIQCVWSEGGTVDAGTLALIHRACLRQAHLVSYGCDTREIPLPKGVKRRTLDASRRWLLANPALPAEDKWLGFDAL